MSAKFSPYHFLMHVYWHLLFGASHYDRTDVTQADRDAAKIVYALAQEFKQ